MPSGVKICVVGKGGREHALIRALGESASQPEVFCFPGSEAIHEIEGAGRVDACGHRRKISNRFKIRWPCRW